MWRVFLLATKEMNKTGLVLCTTIYIDDEMLQLIEYKMHFSKMTFYKQ